MKIITLTAKDIHRGLRNVKICYPKPKHQLENNGKCENQFKVLYEFVKIHGHIEGIVYIFSEICKSRTKGVVSICWKP